MFIEKIKALTFSKFLEYLLYLFVFLLPWQTRWIFRDYLIKGNPFEYGRMSIYGFDILLIMLLVGYIVKLFRNSKKLDIRNWRLEISRRRFGLRQGFGGQTNFKKQAFLLALLGWCFYVLLSCLWSNEKLISLYWSARMFMGWGLFYLMQRIDFSKAKLAAVVVIAGAIQGLLAIWQFVAQNIWPAKYLGIAAQSAQNLGSSVVEFGLERWLRAYGSLPHPNILGGFLVLSLVAALYLVVKLKYKYQKLYLVLAINLISLAVLFSYSRAAWLAWLLTFFMAIGYSLKNKLSREIKQLIGLIVVSLTLVLTIFSLATWPIIKTRLAIGSPTRLERLSITERVSGYQQAEQIIKNNWLLGVGIGNYVFELPNVYTDVYTSVYTWQAVHNAPVLILAELGVLGFFIIFLLNIYLLKLLISEKRWFFVLLFICFYILMLFDHWWWTTASGVYILWLIIALAARQVSVGRRWQES